MMASFYSVVEALKIELAERLHQKTPNREAAIKYSLRDDSAVASSDLEESAGKARLFEFGRVELVKYEWISSTVSAPRIVLPLLVAYPDTDDWRIIAFDDFSDIGSDLRRTPVSTAGAFCVINPESGPTFQDTEGDSWFVMTVPLLSIIEETS